MRQSLNILSQIQVKSPCTEDWNEMVGNDEVRFCSHCSKHVHNLSAMTRREAEELVLRSSGNLCIRYIRRPEDQQIVTLPDWMDRPALRGLVLPVAAGVMAVALNTAPSLAQNSPSAKPAIQVTDPARGKSSFQAAEVKAELSLEGIVKDTTGAVLAGATVKCTNPMTGESLTTTANEQGVFRLGIVIEGDFILDVEAAGFIAGQLPRIRVARGENQRVEVVLQPDENANTVIGVVSGEVLIQKTDNLVLPEVCDNVTLDPTIDLKPLRPKTSTQLNLTKCSQPGTQPRARAQRGFPILQFGSSSSIAVSKTGIYGTVCDETKVVVPKAELRLTNLETGQAISLDSDEYGQFQFEKIPAGKYRLSAEAEGLRRTEIDKIEIDSGGRKEINPILEFPDMTGDMVLVTNSLVDTRAQTELQSEMALDETKTESILLQQVETGDKSAVLALLKQGVKPDTRNEFGETALMLVGNSKTIAKYLVRYGADVNARNQVGATPLMYAMLQEKTFIPKLLIAGGADVNAADQWGRIALMIAAFEGKTRFIKLLIKAGADVGMKDQFGKTALDYALDADQSGVVKLLKAANAELSPTFNR
ncbi:MAG: carboxypeptidase regulatory-like domain-containing protein [Acidobacteria bacterium]|nr:carboxypeptidase regulatory-like domain-containing protein [Acidobacteriota bacterium]